MRILVLEDEIVVALDLQEELRARGHEVAGPAASIEDADALLEQTAIDCALLDANLAGAAPKALAEELRRRGVPFIYVTGYDEDYIRATLPPGPILPKPIDMQDLDELLSSLPPAGAS